MTITDTTEQAQLDQVCETEHELAGWRGEQCPGCGADPA